jgi:hypothetical protein
MRRLSIAFASAVLIAGCGESAEPSMPVAGVTEIAGPYQAQPYRAFDQALVQKLEDECAASVADGRLELVLADGRGGGRVLLVYGGPDNTSGECFASIDANGAVLIEGSSTASSSGADVPGALEVRPRSGGSSSGPGSYGYLSGAAGSDIGRIVIELADGTAITASTGGGNFAAWWPGEAQPKRILGYDTSGTEVANEPY